MIRHKLIKEAVNRVLQNHWNTSVPVDVHQIALRLGIKIAEEPLGDDGFSGFLFRAPGSPAVIGVNSDHHKHRRRFTVAHEIGHFLLHPGDGFHYDKSLIQFRHSGATSQIDSNEIEANRFASELLMPAESIRQTVDFIARQEVNDVEAALKEAANQYEVSFQAFTIRLERMGLLERS